MGCTTSTASNAKAGGKNRTYMKNGVNIDINNMTELRVAMKESEVLEDINFMVFIDFTKSNEWTGEHTFHNKNLHDLVNGTNRYLSTLESLRNVLKADGDGQVAMYTYGTSSSWDCSGHVQYHGCFTSVDMMKAWYLDYSQRPEVRAQMQGPTTLKYVLDEAQRVTKITNRFHIALVLTDGDPDKQYKFQDVGEVYDASNDPISVVTIGIGDGKYNAEKKVPEFPFYQALDDNKTDEMNLTPEEVNKIHTDYNKPKFDNFQFVNLEADVLKGAEMNTEMQERLFVHAFAEVPQQYTMIKNILKYSPTYGSFVHPAPEGYVTEVSQPSYPTYNTQTHPMHGAAYGQQVYYGVQPSAPHPTAPRR
jgi:hypothetical protein